MRQDDPQPTESTSPPFQLPPALQGWIQVAEVRSGGFFADDLFRRKYGGPAPDYGRHIVAFYRDDTRAFHTLSYLHFWRQERIGLIGGGCTDGQVMRRMPKENAAAINEAGGMLRQTLLFCFATMNTKIDAFFGHAGDHRAREVDLAAGFQETADEHLLIRPVGPLAPALQQQLIAQALALGSF